LHSDGCAPDRPILAKVVREEVVRAVHAVKESL
jgi:hypothetical protein